MYKFMKEGVNIWDSSFMQKEGVRYYSRLLYMYFLTCPLSNIFGIYEISESRIKNDLRLEDGEFLTAMQELKELKKVRRCGRFIIIQDAIHYIKKDAKTFKEIDKIIAHLPQKIKERIPKKAVRIIEDYKSQQEERRLLRIKKKIDLTEKNISFLGQELKNTIDIAREKEENVEAMASSREELPFFSQETKISAVTREKEEDMKDLKDSTSYKDFDTFTVEPSEASLNACILENEEEKEITYIQNSNEDSFYTYNVQPSKKSMQKLEDSLKRKKKQEMSDEQMFSLLQKRLKPIYATMKDTEFSPNKKVLYFVQKEIKNFIKENNITVEPLDKNTFNMREFMKQAISFSKDAENVKEREVTVAQTMAFNKDKQVIKEREATVAQTMAFNKDKQVIKEREATVAQTMAFYNDDFVSRVRNDKNFLDVGTENIILSKAEFDKYLETLNDNAEEEEKIELEQEKLAMEKVWGFYRRHGQFSKLPYSTFQKQFKEARKEFRMWRVDILNKSELDILLGKLDKYINNNNGDEKAKIPFLELAQGYVKYKKVLDRC